MDAPICLRQITHAAGSPADVPGPAAEGGPSPVSGPGYDRSAMFKLIPTVRGGAANSPILFNRYATVEEARDATKALIHENARVTRVMIVDASEGSKFVEWIERS